jgi:hypothetical protein
MLRDIARPIRGFFLCSADPEVADRNEFWIRGVKSGQEHIGAIGQAAHGARRYRNARFYAGGDCRDGKGYAA